MLPFRNDVDLRNNEYNRENVVLFHNDYNISSELYEKKNLRGRLLHMKNLFDKFGMNRCINVVNQWDRLPKQLHAPEMK